MTTGPVLLAIVAAVCGAIAVARARRTFAKIIREEAPRMTDPSERKGIDTRSGASLRVTLESDGQWHADVDGRVVDADDVIEDRR